MSGSVGSITSPVEESIGSSLFVVLSGVSFITLSNISNSFAKRLSLFTLKSLPKKSLSQLRILSRSLERRDFFLVGRITFSALTSLSSLISSKLVKDSTKNSSNSYCFLDLERLDKSLVTNLLLGFAAFNSL